MEQARKSPGVRAPQGDGQTLIEPPMALLPEVVAQNRRRTAAIDYDVQGRSLAELAASARQALVRQAVAHTSTYREVPEWLRRPAAAANVPFLLSGHQPQLFHPGVWYKNFVLGALAGHLHAVGIHVLIDSDMCRSASIRVPTGTINEPRVEAVPYDEPAAEVPYEERRVRDEETFASFGGRVASLVRPLVSEPLVTALWSMTLKQPRQASLGLRLAAGRHRLEAEWGNDTLELPQSAVCNLPEFAWFVAHLLAHLPRLWSAYNDALAAYRRAHRQRNRAHPVPDLAEVDGWLEAPFWIWSSDDPQRRPLFARQSGDKILLSDRHARAIPLTLSADGDAAAATDELLQLASRGIKIRTRALTTTLFARLVLSDLFLHGIGGAKYDQVTDQIGESFFGFPLPDFAAVSATLRLPIAPPRDEPLTRPSCTEQLRELRFHPERFIESNGPGVEQSAVQKIIDTKTGWIGVRQTPANARERHRAITSANEALQPFVEQRRQQIERQCHQLQQRKRAEAILRSREYAFCLYPREQLAKLMLSGIELPA